MNLFVEKDFKELISVEAFSVKTVLYALVQINNEQGILKDMWTFSMCQIQCNYVTTTLRESYIHMANASVSVLAPLEPFIGTVSSFQVSSFHMLVPGLIILNAAQGPLDTRTLVERSLLDCLWSL